MNRQAAITRARALLQQRATRISNKPTISTGEDGNFMVKIGTGGIVIRLSRSDKAIEPAQAAG